MRLTHPGLPTKDAAPTAAPTRRLMQRRACSTCMAHTPQSFEAGRYRCVVCGDAQAEPTPALAG